MADPRIAAGVKAMQAQIAARGEKAQFINTIKVERAKAQAKAKEQAEDRALTVKQRQMEAAKANQQAEAQAQESVEAVMPMPEVVRTDPKGIENSLATGSAGAIGGLAGINGGGAVQRMNQLEKGTWSGGPPMTQGQSNPMDPLGLNRQDPTSGGKAGSNLYVTPGGQYMERSRQPIQTGLRGVDVVNALVGAMRGGKYPLSATQEIERHDMMRQHLMDAAAARDAEAQAVVDTRNEERAIEADQRAERQVTAHEGQLGVSKSNLALARERLSFDQQKFLSDKDNQDLTRYIADVNKVRDLELSESKDWSDRNKGFFEARAAIEGVGDLAKEAARGNSSAGVQLVYAAAKAQDPRISNQDFQYMANSGSLAEKVQGWYTKALSGDLTPRMIEEITSATRANMMGQERAYRYFKKQNEARLRAQGLDPTKVLIDPLPSKLIEIPSDSPIPFGAKILREEE